MIFLELDPNLVKPGWTALIIVIVLAAIMVFLFVSMMRQMRKIKVPRPADDDQSSADDHQTDDQLKDENHKAT
ncbi:hypothetical protein [Microlunatus parietis]|uniref:Beta-lactam-binding protein with PASTA domain n=1 Tax=Microlunatus parietis TaxID=682979 RepID=A0A7Y9LA86_9ACTN|nr:hypothetical protein [Microlunatus parietis]NYE70397.1 beta-lactam-binding protein with PASTA domain [Microlunatus parietis]